MSQPELRERLQADLGSAYRLERELPRGGMSRVFVATETALDRPVVVKVLAPELTATLSAERFKREIGLAARLQHPNIVPLLAAGQAGTSLYYTMPLVDGESLRERLGPPMALPEACRILEEVGSALDYAHAQGIVHRDIKPENIMFFHGRAVVLDFGIGKAVTAAARADKDVRITQAGVSLGTPAYIAPEQASGDPDLDHRADLFALGVVAYEMFTGHPPYRGRTPQQVLMAHHNQAVEPLATKRPDVPAHVARAVMQCLARDPGARPGNAAAIVDASTLPIAGAATSPGRLPAWLPWAIAVLSIAVAITALIFR